MPEAPEQLAFVLELNAKLNELIEWAIDNRPEKEKPLHINDFAKAQEQFRNIACGIDELAMEPEPEDGGAQYVPVTPAPWP